MNVRITVRHIEIKDEVKERTDHLTRKLHKFDSRLSQAEIIFDAEGPNTTVEGILHIDRDDPVVAKASAIDPLAALDQLMEKLAKILRRRRSQVTRHRGGPKVDVASEPDPELESEFEFEDT